MEILSQLGEDLATSVKEKHLQTTNLDISVPKVRKLNVLDAILLELAIGGIYSSIIIINDDVEMAISYVNSLAILMSQQNHFQQIIEASCKRIENIYPFHKADKLVNQLFGKKLHTLDIEKLLSMGEDKKDWDELFPQVLEEARVKNCCLVIYDLQKFWNLYNKERLYYQALSFLYSVRLKKFTYITALNWNDYVYHIERGMIPRLVEFSTPILLTPRPKNLPPALVEDFSPDKNFDFQGV